MKINKRADSLKTTACFFYGRILLSITLFSFRTLVKEESLAKKKTSLRSSGSFLEVRKKQAKSPGTGH
jgi:hypothetical protein